MIEDYFKLSFKNLKKRGLRSWLTLLGIFIGVVAVVSLISLGEALKFSVASQFGIGNVEVISVRAGGVNSFGPPGSSVATPLGEKELFEIKSLSSVKRAIGQYIKPGKIEYNKKTIFGYFSSVPPGEDRKFLYEQLDGGLAAGRFLDESDSRKVILGYNFYVDKIGFDKPVYPGRNVLINDQSFEVIGILEKKGSFIYDNVVYMNEEDFKNLFNVKDDIAVIQVQPVDRNEMEKTKEDIEKALRKIRNVKEGNEDFEVSTPEASLSTLNSVLSGVQIFIVIVASISIFIGALGIVNTMTASVLERRRDIGVMKSVGARNSQVFLQFFIEASLLGLIGGLFGALFGTLLGVIGTASINAFLGSDISPNINFSLIFLSLAGSFLVGGISGIAPAMRAAKQNPVDALRS